MTTTAYIAIIFLILTLGNNREIQAEEYYWRVPAHDIPYHLQPKHPDPDSVCRWLYKEYDATWIYTPAEPGEEKNTWECPMFYDEEDYMGAIAVLRFGESCADGKIYNQLSGQCETKSSGGTCPSSLAGNPIDFSTGKKIQEEVDYIASRKINQPNPLFFSRVYTSARGVWTHNYAARLNIAPLTITLFHPNGDMSVFDKAGANYSAKRPERGLLTRENNHWRYQSTDNHFYEFDERGQLVSIQYSGMTHNIKRLDKKIIVTDTYGTQLEIAEDARGQPIRLATEGIRIDYTYNRYKQLRQVTRHFKEKTDKKEYLYEDRRNPTLLTAIKDERGIRYASWTYDDESRAISSEHVGGTEKTKFIYNTDGSTTVINPLGKKTNYIFDYIQGIKHIIAINGEPTANCPDSNSLFTYDARGHLKTKIDNNGNVTEYVYNDRGLEISRTEASGTNHSKTITTEWHPTLFSPARIIEANRQTKFTYDAQGRQLSKSVTSH